MKVGKRARGRTNCGMEGSDQRPSSVRLEDAKSVATRLPKGSNTSESHGIAHSPGLRETIGDAEDCRDALRGGFAHDELWWCSVQAVGT